MNHSPAPEETESITTYPAASDRATLASFLQSEIESSGPMPFDQWMSHCLYHPQWGYYNKGAENVGREGDFYTSVSVGRCFGMLLAHRIISYCNDHPQLQQLDLVETGANNGQLALDILETLAANAPELYSKLRYTICEPLSSMQSKQSNTLAQHQEKLTHLANLNEVTTPYARAIFLSNELIDAFPVKLIKKQGLQWCELYVDFSNDQFSFFEQAIQSNDLASFVNNLPDDLPDGYQTEFRPGLPALAELYSKSMQQGLVLTIDYGHTAADYYSPERHTGSLRTFYQHTAGEDPLRHIGEQDITAHVDFSQLTECFESAGFETTYFNSQSRYLTQHATQWFAAIESSLAPPPSKLIRQFQTLTHPTMMGRQFHVLECEK